MYRVSEGVAALRAFQTVHGFLTLSPLTGLTPRVPCAADSLRQPIEKKEKETSMKSKRIIAPAMLVLALLLIAPAARAQVLQQVPSDALLVIKFNKLKPTTDNSYVANWGKYAAIGTSQDIVQKKPDGLTAQGIAGKELAEKDIVIFANMKAVRTHVMPHMAKAREQFIKGFEQGYTRSVNQSAPRGRGAAGAGAQPASQPAIKFT